MGIRKAETFAECIDIHEESIGMVRRHLANPRSNREDLKQIWGSALESLQKALELTKQEEDLATRKKNAEKISQLASQYPERANFVKLSKRAKKVADEKTK